MGRSGTRKRRSLEHLQQPAKKVAVVTGKAGVDTLDEARHHCWRIMAAPR